MGKPLFRKTRIFLLAMSHVRAANRTKDAEVRQAHGEMVALCKDALTAIREGKEDEFMMRLANLQADRTRNELDAMLSGKHPDLPEWLRK